MFSRKGPHSLRQALATGHSSLESVPFRQVHSSSGWFTSSTRKGASILLGVGLAASTGLLSLNVFAENQVPEEGGHIKLHSEKLSLDGLEPIANVWGWGQGFIFDKEKKSTSVPVPPHLLNPMSKLGVKDFAMGNKSAAWTTERGEFYIWTEGSDSPLLTQLTNVVKTACGRAGLIAAVTAKGDVLLWDPRPQSQGGLVNFTDDPPKKVDQFNYRTINLQSIDPSTKEETSWWWPWGPDQERFVNVACGAHHVVLLTSKGRVFTLGTNTAGQCGLGADSFHPEPKPLEVLNNIIQVACGDKHTVCLANDGAVIYFGNDSFSTSTGKRPVAYTPVELMFFREAKHVEKYGKVKAVVCGGEHTLALTEKGALFGWGNSKSGQIPIGRYSHTTEITRVTSTPFAMPGDKHYDPATEITQLECGSEHCMTLTAKGELYAFGNNYLGQCGFKERSNVNRPRRLKVLEQRKDKIKRIACAENVTVVIEK